MRIIFIGTGEIGVPTLRLLLESKEHHVLACVTQPDKPAGRHQEMQGSPIKLLAWQHHVPIFQPLKIREASAIEQLRYQRADTIVVMAYGQILPREVLRMPAVACLNLHASLLPRHRGAAPIQAAIQAGDRESGITVMYMNEGLDTGDILLTKAVRIGRRETAGTLHDRLGALAPIALAEALTLLKQGRAPRMVQDASQATYAPKLTRESGRIEWTQTSEEIDRRIRAMNPWPGAFTWLPGPDAPRKLKLFSCIQHRRVAGEPGTVLRADKNGLLVAAGDGGVLLREIQLEGKKRMAAGDFLLGTVVAPGTVLGVAPGSGPATEP
jgi:methionyl-tRNA formyltransferase